MSIIQAVALLLQHPKMKKGWGKKPSRDVYAARSPILHPTLHAPKDPAPTLLPCFYCSCWGTLIRHQPEPPRFCGQLRLWHKIQGQGKGTSRSRNKEMPQGLEIQQTNPIHECKQVFLPTFPFDHFTRRCSLLAKQHWPTCSHAEHQAFPLLCTSHGKSLATAGPLNI